MYRKKRTVYRVWYYAWFQASTGSLGMDPPWVKVGTTVYASLVKNFSILLIEPLLK